MHKPVDPKCDLDAICEWIPEIKAREPGGALSASRTSSPGRAPRAKRTRSTRTSTRSRWRPARAKARGLRLHRVQARARAPGGRRGGDGSGQGARGDLAEVVARIRRELDAREAARRRALLGLREHQPARARAGQLARLHAPAAHLPHAVAAPGADADGPLQLPRAPRRREGARSASARRTPASRARERPAGAVGGILDRFDASHECREVTCLYNGVNWWLEKLVHDPTAEVEIERRARRLFLYEATGVTSRARRAPRADPGAPAELGGRRGDGDAGARGAARGAPRGGDRGGGRGRISPGWCAGCRASTRSCPSSAGSRRARARAARAALRLGRAAARLGAQRARAVPRARAGARRLCARSAAPRAAHPRARAARRRGRPARADLDDRALPAHHARARLRRRRPPHRRWPSTPRRARRSRSASARPASRPARARWW